MEPHGRFIWEEIAEEEIRGEGRSGGGHGPVAGNVFVAVDEHQGVEVIGCDEEVLAQESRGSFGQSLGVVEEIFGFVFCGKGGIVDGVELGGNLLSLTFSLGSDFFA